MNLAPLFLSGFLATCGGVQPAAAQAPDAIGMHIGSVHSNNYDPVAKRNWNNANPGLYAKWNVGNDMGAYVVGSYYNSIRKQSVYAGYAYPVLPNLDVVVGVVSGYNGPGYRAKAIMPMVVPSLHFPITDTISARFNLAIGVGKGSATALNFALEYRL